MSDRTCPDAACPGTIVHGDPVPRCDTCGGKVERLIPDGKGVWIGIPTLHAFDKFRRRKAEMRMNRATTTPEPNRG